MWTLSLTCFTELIDVDIIIDDNVSFLYNGINRLLFYSSNHSNSGDFHSS